MCDVNIDYCHQYGISVLASWTSFWGDTSGNVARCWLFSQAKTRISTYTSANKILCNQSKINARIDRKQWTIKQASSFQSSWTILRQKGTICNLTPLLKLYGHQKKGKRCLQISSTSTIRLRFGTKDYVTQFPQKKWTERTGKKIKIKLNSATYLS